MPIQHVIPDEGAFIDFLQAGRLGTLHPGLSENQVHHLLDKPDNTLYPAFSTSIHENEDQSSEARMMILEYGNLRVLFEYGLISYITVDYRYEDYGLPTNLGVRWFNAIKEMKLDSFRQFLEDKEILYEQLVLPDIWSNTILVLDNAEVLFATRDTDSIDAISFSVEKNELKSRV